MSDTVDVAVIGAGPYGLALSAHLRSAGVDYRQFGIPMRLWKETMPKGMFLKSQGFASNISDPDGTHTLEAFCKKTNHPYASYGLPVSLENFVNYGQWFRAERGLEIEETTVTDVTPAGAGFELTVGGIDRVRARRVVVAIGVEAFAHVAEPLSALPSELCTHSSAHQDLAVFNGQQVIVVGAGQSALETAALLHENGASVQVLVRKGTVAWNGTPLAPDRPLLQRLREPESGLGSGLATWFYSNHPDLFRRLPAKTRVFRARTALGPAGAGWPRPRSDVGDRAGRPGAPDGRPGRSVQPGVRGRPRDRRDRLPYRPAPAPVPARDAPVPAGDPGREPGGGTRLSVLGARLVLRGHRGGALDGTGHALRLRHLARRARRGPQAGGYVRRETATRRPRESVMTPVTGNARAQPSAVAARLRLGDVPMVLMYHGVADEAEDPHHLCVAPSRFAEQLAWLKRRGLRGVSIGTLVDAMRAGRPRGLVGITFDDGYVSVLEAALPELRRHGFTPTPFT